MLKDIRIAFMECKSLLYLNVHTLERELTPHFYDLQEVWTDILTLLKQSSLSRPQIDGIKDDDDDSHAQNNKTT